MEDCHTEVSPAFKSGMDQSKLIEKKYAEKRAKNWTEGHLLLDLNSATRARDARVTTFVGKCLNAAERWDTGQSKLTVNEREVLRKIIGAGSSKYTAKDFSCLASNPHGRKVFFDEAYRQLVAIHADQQVKMYFATIIDSQWSLNKDAKSFDIKSMMLRAKRALRDMGYDGVLIMEIQAVTNLTEAKFLPHLHGFVWPKRGTTIGPRQAVTKLHGRFEGIRKATGVILELMPFDKPNTVATRFFYATKLPDTAKSYCPAPDVEKSFIEAPRAKLKTASRRNYTDRDALRIAGILGQYEIDQIVVAVGEGTKVHKAASKSLTSKAEKMRNLHADPSPYKVLALLTKLLRE